MKRFLWLPLLVMLAGCASALPNLTPPAIVAFHGTQIIKALDVVRDVADNAHKTNPPLLDAATTLKIVNWHESAIKTVHTAPAGWQSIVLTGLDELKKNLSPADASLLSPYIDAAKTALKEIA